MRLPATIDAGGEVAARARDTATAYPLIGRKIPDDDDARG
jgi:hypothetical protein